MKPLTIEEVIAINAGIVHATGGSIGLRDAGALAMCVTKPFQSFGGKETYPDVFSKAAAVLESIARNHPFIDGNKRTAFISAVRVIERNGYLTHFDNRDVEEMMVRIVVEKTPLEEIVAWLKKNSTK